MFKTGSFTSYSRPFTGQVGYTWFGLLQNKSESKGTLLKGNMVFTFLPGFHIKQNPEELFPFWQRAM